MPSHRNPPARIYLTTTIPYVNGRPHLGHALEYVQADVLARHYRRRGEVRFQTGTDDNSLKNVLAAQAAGVPVQDFVDTNAAAFVALRGPLSLSFDDVIRTSTDPRHRAGVEYLWQSCERAGDLYRKQYQGLYCVGCEQFYAQQELAGGRCPEHGTIPELISEENWFFRLSRYAGLLREEISAGRLRIEPEGKRNEVLAFIAGGLADFSISRSVSRARGWGIPVPGDPSQVIYVWWDALGNYLTALGYGADDNGVRRWWHDADQRIHLLGKGVLRFHAVYWPAMLASAGLPLPTRILVHDYLTIGGAKISKSGGASGPHGTGTAGSATAGPAELAASYGPAELAARYGTDALRWWLLREVPQTGDTDFTEQRLVARANDELANGIGNLVNRVIAMICRYRDGEPPRAPAVAPAGAADVLAALERAPGLIDDALAVGDFRRATSAVWAVAEAANRFVSQARPWDLAAAERARDTGAGDLLAGDARESGDLDAVLGLLLAVCAGLATLLGPFLPDAATRIAEQCGHGGALTRPVPVFARISSPLPATF